MICASLARESWRLSDVRVGRRLSVTGGVPASGGGLGRALSSDGDGVRVGAGRRSHPLGTKAVIHPLEEGKEGGTSARSMGLRSRSVCDPRPGAPFAKGLELTPAKAKA